MQKIPVNVLYCVDQKAVLNQSFNTIRIIQLSLHLLLLLILNKCFALNNLIYFCVSAFKIKDYSE